MILVAVGVTAIGEDETWQILVWAVVLQTREGGFIDLESCKLSWANDDKPLTWKNRGYFFIKNLEEDVNKNRDTF